MVVSQQRVLLPATLKSGRKLQVRFEILGKVRLLAQNVFYDWMEIERLANARHVVYKFPYAHIGACRITGFAGRDNVASGITSALRCRYDMVLCHASLALTVRASAIKTL